MGEEPEIPLAITLFLSSRSAPNKDQRVLWAMRNRMVPVPSQTDGRRLSYGLGNRASTFRFLTFIFCIIFLIIKRFWSALPLFCSKAFLFYSLLIVSKVEITKWNELIPFCTISRLTRFELCVLFWKWFFHSWVLEDSVDLITLKGTVFTGEFLKNPIIGLCAITVLLFPIIHL